MSDYKKLKIESDASEGSFVRELKGETGTGFQEGAHVHKDWWQTTIGYDEAHEFAQRAEDERLDLMVPAKDIRGAVDHEDNFALDVRGRLLTPTDWALQQFSARTPIPSSTMLPKMKHVEGFDIDDAGIMADIANNYLRRIDQEKIFRLRTYHDGTCRAFLTDRYAPIDNRWYLKVLEEFLPEARLSHWRGDEDTIYCNLLLPDTVIDYGQEDDSDYGGMVSISNCEIGKRKLGQIPSLFRAICLNGCIWGQTKGQTISRRHVGSIDLDLLKVAIAENIEHQLNLIPDGIRSFLATQGQGLLGASVRQAVAVVADDFGFSRSEATEVFNQHQAHESHAESAFGVINAVTRAGQTLKNERWVAFDAAGGRLVGLGNERWAGLMNKARSLKPTDLGKIYAAVN